MPVDDGELPRVIVLCCPRVATVRPGEFVAELDDRRTRWAPMFRGNAVEEGWHCFGCDSDYDVSAWAQFRVDPPRCPLHGERYLIVDARHMGDEAYGRRSALFVCGAAMNNDVAIPLSACPCEVRVLHAVEEPDDSEMDADDTEDDSADEIRQLHRIGASAETID